MTRRRLRPAQARRAQSRRGAAAVEAAVCLPLLITIVFGSIQACNLLFLNHALTTAAYEATLEASKPGATRASVTGAAVQMLDAFGVDGASVSISPSSEIADITLGAEITIVVSAPVSANVTGPAVATPNQEATATGVAMR